MFNINKSWLQILGAELKKPYMKNIEAFLAKEISSGKNIYPSIENMFNALNLTNFEDIKVVIIGQDPYHQKGQANGLCFSVSNGIKIPPSLKNIFKEINRDLLLDIPESGDLTRWANQGVLLLNSILSVEKGKPASHNNIGWEKLTNKIIEIISSKHIGIVFLLWGKFAQKKESIIDSTKHYILETSHPSPFSAYRGFLGSNCFSQANNILRKIGKKEINW